MKSVIIKVPQWIADASNSFTVAALSNQLLYWKSTVHYTLRPLLVSLRHLPVSHWQRITLKMQHY